MMNLVNVCPEVIHGVELKISTFIQASASRMCANHLFAPLLCPLALYEMLVVEVVVSNGWTTVFESALLKR